MIFKISKCIINAYVASFSQNIKKTACSGLSKLSYKYYIAGTGAVSMVIDPAIKVFPIDFCFLLYR